MISSTSSSSTAQESAPDETARGACRGPVDAVKKGDFECDEKAFLRAPADGGSFNFTIPNTGAGFLRVRGDLHL